MTATLATNKLLLRPIVQDDYRMRFEIFNDPIACAKMGADAFRDEDVVKQFVDAYQKMDLINFSHHWTICLKNQKDPIGFCDVYLPSPHLRNLGVCEVAFGLLEAYRGYGLMQEALSACLSQIIHKAGLFRIEASVNPVNKDSIGLLESIGFRYEGIQRQKWVWGGARHDMLAYALLAHEFCSMPVTKASA